VRTKSGRYVDVSDAQLRQLEGPLDDAAAAERYLGGRTNTGVTRTLHRPDRGAAGGERTMRTGCCISLEQGLTDLKDAAVARARRRLLHRQGPRDRPARHGRGDRQVDAHRSRASAPPSRLHAARRARHRRRRRRRSRPRRRGGEALDAGESAAGVVRAATHRPVIEPRTLRRGGLEVKVESSQSPLGATQRAIDAALHKSAEASPAASPTGSSPGRSARPSTPKRARSRTSTRPRAPR
jgi:hypothetical protein